MSFDHYDPQTYTSSALPSKEHWRIEQDGPHIIIYLPAPPVPQ